MSCVCLLSEMMESCLAGKPERVGPVEVDDIRRDLLGEFSALPAQVAVQEGAADGAQRRFTMLTDVFSHQDSVPSQSENLQVYLRVRPFTAAESDNVETQVTHTHTHVQSEGLILR